MTTNTNLGPRPSVDKISFAADCFATIGTRTYWIVLQSALHSGPARFDDKAAAEAFAAKRGRDVIERSENVLRRIKWA